MISVVRFTDYEANCDSDPSDKESVSKVGIELNQTTFLNAECAEEFAEERKGEHCSESFAKTSALSALSLALNHHTPSF